MTEKTFLLHRPVIDKLRSNLRHRALVRYIFRGGRDRKIVQLKSRLTVRNDSHQKVVRK
jgi:hypothetical protein